MSQLPGAYCSSYTSCPSGFSVTITALCCEPRLRCAALPLSALPGAERGPHDLPSRQEPLLEPV